MMSDIEKEAGTLILKEYSEFFKKQYQEFIIHSDNHTWEDNRNFHPIQTLFEPIEHLPIIDLVFSDNTLMTKILGVFSTLCVEVIKLRKEATERHFPYLALHDDYKNVNIASQIDAICNLNAFVIRCEETLRNLCAQVFALYGDVNIKLAGIQLHYIINHIGELFTLLVLLELIICNSTLSANWSNYCKNIKMLGHTHAENLVEEKFAALMGAIENITSKIMSDNIVQNAFTALSSLRKNLVEKSCSEIATEFTQYVKIAISNLEKLIQDKQNINNMRKCIKINAIYVLNSYLFGTNDKKVFRALVDLNTKAHSIPVVGIILWFPEQFLQRYLPSLGSLMSKVPQTMFKARHNYINNKKASLNRDEVHLQNLCTHWILTVDKMFCTKHMQLNAAEMNIHTKTILNGLDILSHTNYSVLTLINLHSSLGLPLSKTVLMSVFRIIEILKGLKNAVITNYDSIISSINMIIQHMIFQASSLLLEVKKSFISDKNFDNQRLDELTCIFVAERALKGPVTSERLVTTNVALSLLPDAAYPDGSYARLGMLFENIQSLINFMTCVNTLCDVSWLYWHQNIVSVYLDQNFTHRLDGIRLKYLFSALEDCALMLHKIDNECNCNKSEEFLDQMKLNIENAILNTTSQQIETNLRLHIHSHLQLDTVNPFTLDMLKKSLLVIDKFKLLRVYMSVIPSAEHYLSTMYYNLTTVVLSDWKTYGEMRQMARFKFGLKTIEDNLPTQTLEQGLDVLEIMRNIHIFVSKYLYNLNNQIFIEKSSNNKHLNSINIKHIANSIRTHGSGIMNTTVNFTYQFLRKKFFTFSQFMYDEHIKSRLIKDLRNFRENSATNGNMYSYKNADKFNKGIRNLGLAEDGQSYLDLFRDLISQIGNAMGYVRMIRSGGRHSCADATVFLPNLDQNKSFKELCEDSGLNITTIEAAENLDNNINNLMSNFTQGTEYFKLLVDVFAPVFRNPKNVHLKNFFIIVPPLTLNFIEHIILAKDKMTKKNKVGAAFSDDGFAMGIAYILRLLDQDSHFESLHWFQSVWKHINNEKSIVEEQKLKGSMQLQQALALTEKKLKILEEEFQLLYYSLTSARIFFR